MEAEVFLPAIVHAFKEVNSTSLQSTLDKKLP